MGRPKRLRKEKMKRKKIKKIVKYLSIFSDGTREAEKGFIVLQENISAMIAAVCGVPPSRINLLITEQELMTINQQY